jgi:hypothetical protein
MKFSSGLLITSPTFRRRKMEKDVVERMGKALNSPLLSPTALSNLYTMGATSQIDPRQQLPSHYTMPPQETRELRAKLILEEALETVEALGFEASFDNGYGGDTVAIEYLVLKANKEPNMEGIIDGCCDLHYVEVTTSKWERCVLVAYQTFLT